MPKITGQKIILPIISGFLLALIIIIHFVPIKSITIISPCGNGTTQIERYSMILERKSVSQWESDVESTRQLLSGVPLCADGNVESPLSERLYIL